MYESSATLLWGQEHLREEEKPRLTGNFLRHFFIESNGIMNEVQMMTYFVHGVIYFGNLNSDKFHTPTDLCYE